MCYASIIEINQVGERVMKSERNMSTHASAAKMIRKELKEMFPNTKFSVTSKSYSGGNSVDATWIDGPASEMVEKITNKYQYGKFDGMIDSYEYSNVQSGLPQVKFTFAIRDISNDILKEVFELAKDVDSALNGIENLETEMNIIEGVARERRSANYYMRARLSQMDLTNGFNLEVYKDLVSSKSIYHSIRH